MWVCTSRCIPLEERHVACKPVMPEGDQVFAYQGGVPELDKVDPDEPVSNVVPRRLEAF